MCFQKYISENHFQTKMIKTMTALQYFNRRNRSLPDIDKLKTFTVERFTYYRKSTASGYEQVRVDVFYVHAAIPCRPFLVDSINMDEREEELWNDNQLTHLSRLTYVLGTSDRANNTAVTTCNLHKIFKRNKLCSFFLSDRHGLSFQMKMSLRELTVLKNHYQNQMLRYDAEQKFRKLFKPSCIRRFRRRINAKKTRDLCVWLLYEKGIPLEIFYAEIMSYVCK